MHPYSYHIVQFLSADDYIRRTEFCEFLITKLQEDENFLSKIIWTDESKFTREGIINRKNLHFWASQNPHLTREANFQQKFSYNVFVLMMGTEISYEIYEENLTSARYIDILRGTVTNFCENLPLNVLRNCWYQMDGAPAHSSREVFIELTRMFDDRWLGNNGPWRWPPRSPDLTPADFYLWGHIKNLVYFGPVDTREDLLNRIITAFEGLQPEQIRKACVCEVEARIMKCLNANGRHIEHI